MEDALIRVRTTKGGNKNENRRNDKKGLYIGAEGRACALCNNRIAPGSFIGGVIGLNIAGSIFRTPVSSAVLPRIIVGASMVLGILVSGLVFVTNTSLLGWLAGHAMDAIRVGKEVSIETRAEKSKGQESEYSIETKTKRRFKMKARKEMVRMGTKIGATLGA